MRIYGNSMQSLAEVDDPKNWDQPCRVGRSKYSLVKMDEYFNSKIFHLWPADVNGNRMTRTEVILRIIDLTPKKYFRGSHLRHYERDLKERLFRERLTNKH